MWPVRLSVMWPVLCGCPAVAWSISMGAGMVAEPSYSGAMSGAGRSPACAQTRFVRAARAVRRRGVVCPLLSLSEQVVNHVACAGRFHTSMGAGMVAERWDTQ